MVGHLPRFGLGVDVAHDLVARSGCPSSSFKKTDGIGTAFEVSPHHGVEVAFDQRQVGEVIERRPVILRVVLTLGEWSMQLLVAQSAVLHEQPVTTFVEFGLEFDTIHSPLLWCPP